MSNIMKYAEQCETERLNAAITEDLLLLPEFETEELAAIELRQFAYLAA